nr:hypothetical protein [Tanacetum cinerariifolium]
MSSITAQAKLNIKLTPKEKILEIGKCNGSLNPGKIHREPTFQIIWDALALTLCYSAFLITADVPKRPAKNSTEAPARGVVIRETPEMSLTKKKEKVDVTRGVPDVTEEESSESEVKSWGNDEDDRNNKQDSSGSKFNHEEDEDDEEEMDYTTSQLYDDVEIRLNEPVDTDKEFVQEEGTDATMTNVQQRNENLKILQVIKDANVTLSTIPHKTEVPVTSSSHSSDMADKLLNFPDIPQTDAKIISPMDVHVHHEKRKNSKDVETAKGPKAKESQSGSSKGDKSQSKFSGKSVPSEDPDFKVVDSDTQDQVENPGNDDEEPKEKVTSKRDWFTKPTQPQEPTDPNWNVGKTPQQGQKQSWLMTLASSAEK